MRTTQMRGWMVAGGIAVALGASALWMTHRSSEGAGGAGSAGGSGWSMIGATSDTAPQAGAATNKAMSPDQVRTRLFKEGSFAGTEPSGDWCVVSAKLSPCPDLRKRFEYYILGLGEVTIDDIKALVADEARKAHGEQLGNEIMAIWDKYWQVRTYQYRNKFDQSDRSTWLAVFDEQKQVRRQILGADWAKAFFDQDEQNFKQYYAQLESGLPPPPDPGEPVPQMAPGKDPAAVHAERVARYGQAAADRLAKVDEEWADWERRLAGARTEWDRLKSAPNLSDTQRKQEMQAYINSHFKPDEHLRVEALLHL
ncbi:MAG TPA: lipase secretion chaperone [Aquabacterium sp.]|uniref:lipase secretion chaperone n=1 Tax=Aquabacterium sp. TaxID=1872578 RepID=UPI002E380588|nr:lipase secretion chaperone [Aquabacterium sp.]HEX5357459.1 lipase secretion chaperone [Aquabacterium sp.]